MDEKKNSRHQTDRRNPSDLHKMLPLVWWPWPGSSSGPKIIEAIKPRFVEPCMPVSGSADRPRYIRSENGRTNIGFWGVAMLQCLREQLFF